MLKYLCLPANKFRCYCNICLRGMGGVHVAPTRPRTVNEVTDVMTFAYCPESTEAGILNGTVSLSLRAPAAQPSLSITVCWCVPAPVAAGAAACSRQLKNL